MIYIRVRVIGLDRPTDDAIAESRDILAVT